MAEEAKPKDYQDIVSYRINFARIMKIPKGGEVWFGEEARLSATTLAEAKLELKGWQEAHKDDKTIGGTPHLLEIRSVIL
ncbi:MAG: hypothetical protein Q7S73_00065 [bacterium]|nr:hypothetical protein [bacterium]